MSEQKNNSLITKLIPVMLAFFAMGFVDSVGTAANFVKKDFALNNFQAFLCSSAVFFWFLIFSVPTGMLMNKIGRRKTVLISLWVTLGALLLPLIPVKSLTLLMVSFSLLGIGNALMQVSLNPLVSNIVTGDKLASTMTFGQFVKAIASWSATVIAPFLAAKYNNWTLMYAIFALECVLALIFLGKEKINEEEITGKPSTFAECLALLGDGTILLCFIGIMCHVGIDVGTNTAAPQILMDKVGLATEAAMKATGIYFIFRTIGCFAGSFLLSKISAKIVFAVSVVFMLLAMGGLFVFNAQGALFVCVALIGLGNSNVFPIIFSQAILHKPEKKNEISGLMIMGLIGGAIFPPVMGFMSDMMASQTGSVIVITVGVIYLLALVAKIKKTA
ncbi:MFS transporter [Candidatus Avelusimicrobium caledoniensis]|uniref:MFS transporter n=1 Tax=Candidatus Avelusimicrobium caledoniensis TaxID=3416220 RepID=UPI003D097914